ncbi:MAG TPA: XdhC/CoxI family protein [Thermodesulfobacteriota bacterium]|nr:XdhC/CoxI family protein [Thermodesulfobacteriota bacterium]
MENIYSEILKSLERKEKAALATIITRTGSAPRAVGAKYLIRGDGSSVGSIGGGCVEAEVWQRAQEVMEKKGGKVLRFELTAEQLAEGGLICGGNIDIFIEPLDETSLGIYQETMKIKQKGGTAVLATLVSVEDEFSKGKGSKALIKSSGEKIGALLTGEGLEQRILEEAKFLLKEKRPKLIILQPEKEDSPWQRMEVLLEPVVSEPTVYIFGAGHVSQQIAPLAKRVEFKVVVIDDREIFANRERFPEADEIIVSEFETCFERLEIDDSSYIVIVTRGHLYDGFVLEQAVKTDARYIGMIGSKKKIHILFQNLVKNGIPKEILGRVYAPIGLDINSETPEEIAVSIVAQLIKVRGEY